MRIKLKEDPREWQKFTAAVMIVLSLLAVSFWKRHILPPLILGVLLAFLALVLLVCLVHPRWFRLPYRVGMSIGSAVGQVMGVILLAIFFLLVLTPIAWIVRLLGRDPLKLKKDVRASTYWIPASPNRDFDREY
jgi:DMSO/TMAO reductase YedYZ heme-binding membrane subunit